MPRTHEELERIVLAGINFMTSYLSLRQRIREEYLKLSTSPEWPTLPLSIRYTWIDIYTLADTAHSTMGEDIAELREKQKHYQQNRRGNLRRRSNLRRKRLQARIAATETAEPISLPTATTPPAPAIPEGFNPDDMSELLRQIEEAKAKQTKLPE